MNRPPGVAASWDCLWQLRVARWLPGGRHLQGRATS